MTSAGCVGTTTLCGLFDVPPRALPEVRESGAHFGETDADGISCRGRCPSAA
jgi:glycerol kinase